VPTPGATTIPGENQLLNPCFDGTHNGDPLVWQQTAGWDVSAAKNPCGPNETAARINDPEQQGEYVAGTHDFIWQVVSGRGEALVAKVRCVYHSASVAEMNVYGSDNAAGPWLLVWTPFTLADCHSGHEWSDIIEAQIRLGQAWAYYKVEFHAMFETVAGGVKFTDAYFSSSN
jgi:hypothetical protein